MQYQFSEEIIRAYDIRGIFGKNLSTQDAFWLGRRILQARRNSKLKGRVCIARDGRISSIELHQHLLHGLSSDNLEIIDIGLVPTPVLYFAAATLDNIDAAVMITGSHNPAEYNGFKIILQQQTLFESELKQLCDLEVDQDLMANQITNNDYSILKLNIMNQYIDTITTNLQIDHKIKVVWDPGNGATCIALSELLNRIPGKHIIINNEIDGSFPNRAPDPSNQKYLKELARFVKEYGYDFGIGFDGDGDRIGVIDKNGNFLGGAHLLFIFTSDLLTRDPKAKIITDMKMSKLIIERLTITGCDLTLYKTGHALIKKQIKAIQAKLAVEMSGHIFFAENYYGFDDAILAACKFLHIACNTPEFIEQSLSIMSNSILIEERKITANTAQKELLMNFIKKFLLDNDIKFIDIDGFRIEDHNYWLLFRASNTENFVSLSGEVYNNETYTKVTNFIDNLYKLCMDKLNSLIN